MHRRSELRIWQWTMEPGFELNAMAMAMVIQLKGSEILISLSVTVSTEIAGSR